MSESAGHRRCAVLGHPIAHSLSPVLHRAAYAALGLDWTFNRVDVTEEQLAGWVQRTGREWRGLALTMPLKRAVMPLLDTADDRVQLLGAANTMLWNDDGTRHGANTDVPGLMAALTAAGPLPAVEDAQVDVLGGGATASAAILALAELGHSSITLRVRDAGRAEQSRRLAAACGIALQVCALDASWTRPSDVLVSTVPSTVATAVVPDSAWPRPDQQPPAVVIDVTYDPWPSPLLLRAAANGACTVTGIDLLVHQAAGQLFAMTGCTVPIAVLRDAAESALG